MYAVSTGPDAAAPDPVAPHLGDPRPVLARVERAQRPTAGRAGRRVDPDRALGPRSPGSRRTAAWPPARPSSRRGSGPGSRRRSSSVRSCAGPNRSAANCRWYQGLRAAAHSHWRRSLASCSASIRSRSRVSVLGFQYGLSVATARSAREYLTLLRTSMSSIVARGAGDRVSSAPREAMSPHRIVNPPELGEPSGFSHAVVAAGRTVHLAGQIGAGATIAEQFDRAAGEHARRAPGGRRRASRTSSRCRYSSTDVPAYKDVAAGDRPGLAQALRPPLPGDGAVRRQRAVRARRAGGADGRRGPAGLTDRLDVWQGSR